MKKQIREGVWETNSSSIHTLVISNKNMGRCHIHINKDGYVHIKLNTFYGKDYKDYTSQPEKLTYIITWMFIYHGCNLEDLYSSYMWKEFTESFCKYVNNDTHRTPNGLKEPECVGIKIDFVAGDSPYDFLDHQSTPYGSYDDEHCVVPLYRTEEIMNFIFNKDLWLHTECD